MSETGPHARRPLVGPEVAAWARDALDATSVLPAVHRVGLALVEGGGRRLQFTASDRITEEGGDPDWCHIDGYDDVPLNTAVRSGASVLATVDALRDRYPAFAARQEGTVAIAAVPLVADAQAIGAYVLFFDHEQPLGAEQRQQLEDLGRDLGASLRRVQHGVRRPVTGFTDDEVPTGAQVAVHDVAPDPAAVAPARRFLRTTLTGWRVDEDTVETAALCLSEVVTNAVIHTQAGCAIRLLLDRGVLLTSVRDLGRAERVSADAPSDPLQPHGRGLQLLDALATRWGSTVDGSGTTVWFVLDLG